MIEWLPIFGMLTSTFMVVYIVYLVTQARTRRMEAQVQMQTKLIERFGSAPELVEFLHSPAGRQFVAGVQSAPATMTRERIMGGFTRSIVLTALGIGFIALAIIDNNDWFIPAIIVFSLGLGSLIATFVSWRFSKSLSDGDAFPPALRDGQHNA